MQRFSDEELDREVLYVLKQHTGKHNPVGRWELVSKIFGAASAIQQNDENPADRVIRESIARQRKNGLLVCNVGDGRGSYLASTLEEYTEFRQYYGAAAFDKINTIHSMDNSAKEQFPDMLQPRLI